MAKNEGRLIRLANKRFSEILGEGFKSFCQNYKALILPLAIFQVVLIILNIFLLTDLRLYINSLENSYYEIMDKVLEGVPLTESDYNLLSSFLFLNIALLFLQILSGALISTIAMCSVSNYIYKQQMGVNIKFGESFKSAFNKKIYLPILIIGILLPLGGLLLFIPAIIIFGFFIFLVFTYNMEDVQNPVSEARAIAKGSFWKIVGVFIINYIFIFMINLLYNFILEFLFSANISNFSDIYSSWLNSEPRNYGMIILYHILIDLFDIIFAPLFICLLTSLFLTLKAKKELGYQYQTRYYPVREVYSDPYRQPIQMTQELEEVKSSITQPRIQTEEQFYCPFCGHLIKTPKKFCPNCGESLSFFDKE